MEDRSVRKRITCTDENFRPQNGQNKEQDRK